LPVVSTRVGGMPSAVRDGEPGLLVCPHDEPGFAAALKRVLLDSALRSEFGTQGSTRARAEFSLDRLLRDMDGLYRSLSTMPSSRPGTTALDATTLTVKPQEP